MVNDMKSVKVWDVFIRIFHWTLVGSMIGLYISGDTFKNVHIYLGYLVVCLVLARILWGFFGTKHARFGDFLYKPGTIYNYLDGLRKGSPKHYLGHNPAGGIMIIVMLLSLLTTAVTGLKTIGSEGRGPLAGSGYSAIRLAYADTDESNDEHPEQSAEHRSKNQKSEFWEEIHEAMTGFMIFLIITHIVGVVVSSWAHKENLILSMITGKKRIK